MSRVGREVRKLMFELTPQVEPLSIDEAFMDLTGTERLHGMSPCPLARAFRQARSRPRSASRCRSGLSANKFLAKIASDLDKPRGFAVLGQGRGGRVPRPTSRSASSGASARPARRGCSATATALVADLQRADESDLMKRYGVEGRRLWRLSRGIDERVVNPERETKSVSAETTFGEDIAVLQAAGENPLVAVRARVGAAEVERHRGLDRDLKLKTADFRIRTRARSLGEPTQLAARIFAAGKDLLARETDGTRFRLIGIGLSNLDDAEKADAADLIDLRAQRTADAEHAIDKVRAKFGKGAVVKGLVFDGTVPEEDEEED